MNDGKYSRADIEIAIQEAIDSYTLRLMIKDSEPPDVLIKSYKRLYEEGKIRREDLLNRVLWGIITQKEYNYITGMEVEELWKN